MNIQPRHITRSFRNDWLTQPAPRKATPYHGRWQLVYHTRPDCPLAQTIALAERLTGEGGKTECLCCQRRRKARLPKDTGPETD